MFEAKATRQFDVFYEIRIAVDPLDPDNIFRYDPSDGVYHSADAGNTWERVREISEDVDFAGNVGATDVEMFHIPGKPLSVVVVPNNECAGGDNASDCSYLRSDDGGSNWYKVATPTSIQDVEFAGGADRITLASKGLYRYETRFARVGANPWVNITPPGEEMLERFTVAPGPRKSTVLGPAGDFILRYEGRL